MKFYVQPEIEENKSVKKKKKKKKKKKNPETEYKIQRNLKKNLDDGVSNFIKIHIFNDKIFTKE